MKNLKWTFLVLLSLSIHNLLAQKGDLTGKVIDKEINDVLPFANVQVKGTTIGTTTDFEGIYSLKMDPGVYILNESIF